MTTVLSALGRGLGLEKELAEFERFRAKMKILWADLSPQLPLAEPENPDSPPSPKAEADNSAEPPAQLGQGLRQAERKNPQPPPEQSPAPPKMESPEPSSPKQGSPKLEAPPQQAGSQGTLGTIFTGLGELFSPCGPADEPGGQPASTEYFSAPPRPEADQKGPAGSQADPGLGAVLQGLRRGLRQGQAGLRRAGAEMAGHFDQDFSPGQFYQFPAPMLIDQRQETVIKGDVNFNPASSAPGQVFGQSFSGAWERRLIAAANKGVRQ